MTKTRTQKASLNIIMSALYEIIALICGLLLPRLILQNFGSAYNGIASSIKQFLDLISILNLGVAGSTRVALYKTLANNDLLGSSAIVRAMEKHMRKVGLILLGYLFVLAVFYPLVIKTEYAYGDVALLIIASGISAFGEYFWGAAYQAFLSADQSIYISKCFSIIAVILNTVISAVLIYSGFSIQVVKLGSAGVFLIKPFLQNIYVTKKYHLEKHCESDDTALSERTSVMMHSVANIIHDKTDIIVITLFCGVKAVSVYTVYNLVMTALKNLQSVFTTGTEAIFGDMWVKRENEKIKRNLEYYEFFITTFISIIFSIAIVMLLPFVSLYTEGINDTQYILPVYALVITVAQAFYCIRTPYLTLVQGVGHYKETRNGAVFEAMLNLGTSVILVQFIGIVGVAIGTLLANIFRTCQYALYIDKRIAVRGKMIFVKKILWMCMNMIVIGAVALRFTGYMVYESWTRWIVGGIKTGCISCLFTLVSSFIFYRKDLIGVLKIIRRMLIKNVCKKNENIGQEE